VTGGATPITTSCAPASGTLFPVGLTQVTCTATDTRQQSSACTFTVRIQKPAEISMTRFVAFGDSITLGEDGVTTLTAAPKTLTEAFASPMQILVGLEYPTVVQRSLAARYSLQSIVMHNEGLRGERASLGPLRFGTVLASRLPQAVLIMEGSNDIFDGSTAAIDPAIAGLRSMITTAKNRGVRPYLATVPPMNPAGQRGRLGHATVPLLNARIKALADLEAVTLVDINAAFNGNFAYLASDGLHPNASGFDLIGQTFFTSLRNTLEVAPPTLEPLSSTASFGLR
jgi:lysophospholipase L1-like esterase